MKIKHKSSQWKRPEEQRSKKARKVQSNVKVLFTGFFDCNGVVHHEFLPQGRTVNKEYYLEAMWRLRQAILQKLVELWKNQSWILHHDNAPAVTSRLMCEFLTRNKTAITGLGPELKTPMKIKRFVRLSRYKKNRNKSCWRYQKARFRSVLSIGKNAGISVVYLMGT